eukprot:CAMPEP_0179210148 /NCGR_PEP_ID=MMETSP0796-20121207/104811_1 /TAXON_ID=73915 /ORGANISM="Pyrodinium bahamense, Strain pbaha01" /LENGTH=109 /DNA_ID=CAMNT_0020915111 /DNA_START=32 /DNA_END=361 /DNA_ORIENTATION=-
MCGWLLPRARTSLERLVAPSERHCTRLMPPILALHGTADSLVEFRCGMDIEQRLRQVGVAVSLRRFEGLDHGHTWPIRTYQADVDHFLSAVLEAPQQEDGLIDQVHQLA